MLEGGQGASCFYVDDVVAVDILGEGAVSTELRQHRQQVVDVNESIAVHVGSAGLRHTPRAQT